MIFQIRTKTGLVFYAEEQRRWRSARLMMSELEWPAPNPVVPPVSSVRLLLFELATVEDLESNPQADKKGI